MYGCNVHRWYEAGTGRYTKLDPFPLRRAAGQADYRYGLSHPLRYTDTLGLFEIDPGCDDCPNPIEARDERPASLPILIETGAFCRTGLNGIEDVDLRKCIEQSCFEGRIECSNGDRDLCDEPDVLGCTRRAGGRLAHWLRRIGVSRIKREAVVCTNKATPWHGEAGNTVIHEWAHGCGYDADRAPIPGIPDSR